MVASRDEDAAIRNHCVDVGHSCRTDESSMRISSRYHVEIGGANENDICTLAGRQRASNLSESQRASTIYCCHLKTLLQRDWNLVLGIEKLDPWVTGQVLSGCTRCS